MFDLTPATRAQLDAETLATIDHQIRLNALRDGEAVITHTEIPRPPEWLSGAALIAWARANQPPLVELQPAGPIQHKVVESVPAHVAAMTPTDKMRWARGTL